MGYLDPVGHGTAKSINELELGLSELEQVETACSFLTPKVSGSHERLKKVSVGLSDFQQGLQHCEASTCMRGKTETIP